MYRIMIILKNTDTGSTMSTVLTWVKFLANHIAQIALLSQHLNTFKYRIFKNLIQPRSSPFEIAMISHMVWQDCTKVCFWVNYRPS